MKFLWILGCDKERSRSKGRSPIPRCDGLFAPQRWSERQYASPWLISLIWAVTQLEPSEHREISTFGHYRTRCSPPSTRAVWGPRNLFWHPSICQGTVVILIFILGTTWWLSCLSVKYCLMRLVTHTHPEESLPAIRTGAEREQPIPLLNATLLFGEKFFRERPPVVPVPRILRCDLQCCQMGSGGTVSRTVPERGGLHTGTTVAVTNCHPVVSSRSLSSC